MRAKNLIIIVLAFGLIAIAGGLFVIGAFNQDDSSSVKKSNNIIEETDENNENEPGSETMHEDVAKPDAEEEDNNNNNKEDALEKEEAYTDEDDEEEFIEEGLVAYYPFNDDIKDYSGEERDGTNYGAVFVEGKKGKALNFDGENSYVYSPVNINPIPMPQMTMSAWVKAEDSEKIRIAISSDNGGYDRAMGMDNRQGGQGWSCFAGDGRILGYHPVTVDEWTFLAAVYNQSAGTVKLFVNGSVYEKKAKIVGGGNDFILIGANGSMKLQREFFMGAIDEVKIYDRALSNTELNSLYTTGVAKPRTEL